MAKHIQERLFLIAVGDMQGGAFIKMGMLAPSVFCITVKTTAASSRGQSWSTETTVPGVCTCTGAVCTCTGDTHHHPGDHDPFAGAGQTQPDKKMHN